MKVWSSLLISLLVGIASHPAWAKTSIHGDISRVVDTAHLEFEGMKSWNFEITRPENNKIVLTIPPFDAATEAKLSAFTDPMIQSVTVVRSGPDANYQVVFELAGSNVESFDYLTDDPSRLIIDFYKKTAESSKPAAQTAEEDPEKEFVAGQKTSKPNAKKAGSSRVAKKLAKRNREPAGDEVLHADEDTGQAVEGPLETHFGAFDAGDTNFDRFRVKDYETREDAILASAHNIYLNFPMLKMPVSRLEKLISDEPEYVIHEKPDKENKEARLLALLYQRHRDHMFLKTFAYFEGKYPESEYLEILRNMAAHIHLMEWRGSGKKEEYEYARDLYIELLRKYPDSPLRERNDLILGYMRLERGEALATLQHFQAFVEKYPRSAELPQARKAMAEALILMRKYDDALTGYRSIAKDFAKTPDGPEAHYRLGDVEFSRENWPAAIKTYSQVLKDLPQYARIFPNAHFNKAEALFWNKDYKASLDEFISFLTLFPTHPYGGYAMTRIGEIMGILGVDTRRSMGAFLESSFRYPDNPGAKVARLRMLTQQMKSMRPKDLKKALLEIQNSINEVHLPGMEEFSTPVARERPSRTRRIHELLELAAGLLSGAPLVEKQRSVPLRNSPQYRQRNQKGRRSRAVSGGAEIRIEICQNLAHWRRASRYSFFGRSRLRGGRRLG